MNPIAIVIITAVRTTPALNVRSIVSSFSIYVNGKCSSDNKKKGKEAHPKML